MPPTESQPADAVHRAALLGLFREHPGHRFSCCAPVVSGEGHGPALSAWPAEALAAQPARGPDGTAGRGRRTPGRVGGDHSSGAPGLF
ncbi:MULTISPECIES: DUF4303 domain-containing protein [Streptomyces]|uniref:DUF4303 domain-containing protein n=1 Tax=Streptomyces TaxID=1883 RepID=UPI0006AE3EA7|nr:DUF4303 domain-containing protein [Streptomyces sp. NRRL F-4707]KOX30017.1 hypothetical protein ADL07_21365 [Streptomyces sp. NRRL F-4707]